MLKIKVTAIPVEIRTEELIALTDRMAQDALEEIGQVVEASIHTAFQGVKTGEIYPHPSGGTYQASAAGEAPAIRTGDYDASISHSVGKTDSGFAVAIGSNMLTAGRNKYVLGALLELGSIKMGARPHLIPAVVENLYRIKQIIQAHGKAVK